MFKKRQRNSLTGRPSSAQASYSDSENGRGLNGDAGERSSMGDSPASAGKKQKKKGTTLGRRGGSFRMGSLRRNRPAIEVVSGSFQNVASITTDGRDSRLRQVDFKLTTADRSPGFKIERRLHTPSRHGVASTDRKSGGANAAAGFFVSEVMPGSMVAEQQLVQVGDELISVNGLNVTAFLDVRDVQLLLGGSSRLRMTLLPNQPGPQSPAYTPGEVQRELFPDVVQYQSSPQLRHKAQASKANGQDIGSPRLPDDGGKHDTSATTADGIAAAAGASRTVENGNGKMSPSKSPESNASTLVDACGVTTETKPEESVEPRKDAAKKRATGLKRRNSVLKSAGITSEHDGDRNPLGEMATVFIDQADTMDQDKKTALLAQCLAEEFNLSFFEDSPLKLDFGSFDM